MMIEFVRNLIIHLKMSLSRLSFVPKILTTLRRSSVFRTSINQKINYFHSKDQTPNKLLPKWQYITQGKTPEEHVENAKKALKNGCPWVQLRMKDTSVEIFIDTALELKTICKKYDALLFINDNVEVALASESDGIHLGKNDMSPLQARNILGNKFIIGGTANTFEDIIYLSEQQVNYIGLGPYQFTKTKKILSPVLGIKGYENIIQKMKVADISIPIFGIGGIQLDDITRLMETRIYGIAVSGLLTRRDDLKGLISEIECLVI
ncbi:MAG: thiamine-phosphate pyrophosphorylase [Maribacter sp.]|jgi:thiamine-phosphate pyrophosphorylase